MSDKPLAFLIYGLSGLLLALSPTLIEILGLASGDTSRSSLRRGWATNLAAIASSAIALALLIYITNIQITYLFIFLICAIIASWRTSTISIATVLLFVCVFIVSTKLIWWASIYDGISTLMFISMIIVFIGALELLTNSSIYGATRGYLPYEYLLFVLFAVFCIFLSFSLGLFEADEILFTTWHHWSAYVGPAELMWSGARIFYDMPAQYGLGPTTIIAFSCSIDCWEGMYFVVGAANVLYAATIACTGVLLLGKERTVGQIVVVLVATVTACFLYTAYPPSLGTPSISPSTSGLRFLPCSLLVTYLCYKADKAWNLQQIITGYLLWLFGLLWSPESAFYVTFVWWPFYLFRSISNGPTGLRGVIESTKRMIYLLMSAVVPIMTLFAFYYAMFSVIPSIESIFVYILYPPGPVPFDIHGAIVYMAFVFAVVISCYIAQTYRRRDRTFLRRSLPIFLALFAVSSYYLGRSVDNNLLNIMPFIVLALFVAVSLPCHRQLNAIGSIAVCSIIAITLRFGWGSYWGPAIEQGTEFRIGPEGIVKSLDFTNVNTDAALDRREKQRNPLVRSSDIKEAVDYIWLNYHEPVTLAAPPLVLLTTHEQPWSAINVPENFFFMPKRLRRVFLERTMRRLNQSGWLIVQTGVADIVAEGGRTLVEDFDAVYTRDISLKFGSYTAIRYLPIQNHSITARIDRLR